MNTAQRERTDSFTIREIRIRRNRIRRARQLRRRIVIGIAAIILIISSSLGMTSILSKAATKPDEYKVKTYTSVMVPFGSSLYNMADEYVDYEYYDSIDSYISEVCYINNLTGDDVQPGYYLILPTYVEGT